MLAAGDCQLNYRLTAYHFCGAVNSSSFLLQGDKRSVEESVVSSATDIELT